MSHVRSALRSLGWALSTVVGLYLVGRGVAEFFVVHYSDPASYRNDWGGPSLAGVFAVHSGPGMAVIAVAAALAWRHRSPNRRGAHHARDSSSANQPFGRRRR